MHRAMRALVTVALVAVAATRTPATVWVVAPSGGDFTSIQVALDATVAGDTVDVRTGVYVEKLVLPTSGDAVAGFVTLEAAPGEHPILDGTGVVGEHMILLEDRSWVRIVGLEIRNDLGVTDGSG